MNEFNDEVQNLPYVEMEKLILDSIAERYCTSARIKTFIESETNTHPTYDDIQDVLDGMIIDKKIVQVNNGVVTAYFSADKIPSRYWLDGLGKLEMEFGNTPITHITPKLLDDPEPYNTSFSDKAPPTPQPTIPESNTVESTHVHQKSRRHGTDANGSLRWLCECGKTFTENTADFVDGRLAPRKKADSYKEPETKHDRYVAKMRAEGKCTRCGKPAAPYSNCEECRSKKVVRRKGGSLAIAKAEQEPQVTHEAEYNNIVISHICDNCQKPANITVEGLCADCLTANKSNERSISQNCDTADGSSTISDKYTCPECSGLKSPQSKRCQDCFIKSQKSKATQSVPDGKTTCPDCGGSKLATSKRCRDCWRVNTVITPPLDRPDLWAKQEEKYMPKKEETDVLDAEDLEERRPEQFVMEFPDEQLRGLIAMSVKYECSIEEILHEAVTLHLEADKDWRGSEYWGDAKQAVKDVLADSDWVSTYHNFKIERNDLLNHLLEIVEKWAGDKTVQHVRLDLGMYMARKVSSQIRSLNGTN